MTRAAVVGAGIVGVCTAIYLQREGMEVTLIERDRPASGASEGNCGCMAIGEIAPQSRPGVLKNIPKWLFDSDSPFKVRIRDMPQTLPWIVRFLLNSKASKVNYIAEHPAALTHLAYEAYTPLLHDADLTRLLSAGETLKVFDNKADLQADPAYWALRDMHGFATKILTNGEVQELEPDLSPALKAGVLLSGQRHFLDLSGLVENLVGLFTANGGQYLKGEVVELASDSMSRVSLVLASGMQKTYDSGIITAGYHSRKLMKLAGCDVPIQPLFGYNTTIAAPSIDVGRMVVYPTGGFAASPMSTGLRIAGLVEIAGIN